MNLVYKLWFIACFCLIVSPAARAERLNFLQLIEKHNYTGENHYVTTEDGYILRIDRITSSPLASNSQDKPVVFIQHGLLSASDHFVFWLRNASLAFALADAGYDVWLGNARGNTNSRNHTTVSPDTRPFWSFTIHDLGTKDLPAMVDYVLATTNRKQLSYIGHSLGTTTCFVMLSEKPEYNDKFNIVIYLAPVAYWNPLQSPAAIVIARAVPVVATFYLAPDHAVELLPAGGDVTKLCSTNIIDKFCLLLFKQLIEETAEPLTEEQVAYVTQYFPAGSSLKVLNHYSQNVDTVRFAKYNYGPIENLKTYRQIEPPAYNTSKVTAPTAIFWSHADIFTKQKNVDTLMATLPNVVSYNILDNPKFTHFDYLVNTNNTALYINKVLQLVNQYKS